MGITSFFCGVLLPRIASKLNFGRTTEGMARFLTKQNAPFDELYFVTSSSDVSMTSLALLLARMSSTLKSVAHQSQRRKRREPSSGSSAPSCAQRIQRRSGLLSGLLVCRCVSCALAVRSPVHCCGAESAHRAALEDGASCALHCCSGRMRESRVRLASRLTSDL